jgi:ribonuclease D
MDPNRKAILKSLTRMTHDIAATLELTPSVLASRKDLDSFIDHPERSILAQGWRKNILNPALLEILRKA